MQGETKRLTIEIDIPIGEDVQGVVDKMGDLLGDRLNIPFEWVASWISSFTEDGCEILGSPD